MTWCSLERKGPARSSRPPMAGCHLGVTPKAKGIAMRYSSRIVPRMHQLPSGIVLASITSVHAG
jgi:hypothetical protein